MTFSRPRRTSTSPGCSAPSVQTTADDYAKYAKNWLLFGQGNHCTAVTSKMGVDLLANLTTLLNYKAGANTQTGG